MLPRRRVLGLGLAAVGAAGAAACARADGTTEPDRDLAGEVRSFTDALDAAAPYRPPSPDETAALVPALAALASTPDAAPPRSVLGEHGFAVYTARSAAGARYVVAASTPGAERGWGLYAFPIGQPIRVLAEVPHPNYDMRTERVGLNLLAGIPGAALCEAGAHRRAAHSLADVAHQTSSLFHAVVSSMSARLRIPQVQLHGFDDESHGVDDDVVLSPGSSPVSASLLAVAASLRDGGRRVCRAWADHCTDLEGRTNVQSQAAATAGTPFLHVEMSDAIRDDRGARAEVARVLGAVAH
jgi:hypothetical protein